MTPLLTLPDRIEQTDPEDKPALRELDAEIAVAVGAVAMRGKEAIGFGFFHTPVTKGDWAFLTINRPTTKEEAYEALSECLSIPTYLSSLDAAEALIREKLPGYGHGYSAGPGSRIVTGKVMAPPVDPDASITDGRSWPKHYESGAPTPAQALTAAALRAIAGGR